MTGNGHRFTSATAPRQGGKRGRTTKLTALERFAQRGEKAITAYFADFEKHGPAALAIMRAERPHEYVRLGMELGAKFMIAAETGRVIGRVPSAINVMWLSQPPPGVVEGVDKIPMIEAQAAGDPESGDDDTTPASGAE